QFIVKEVAYMMLKNFLEIKDVNNNISNWQTKVFNILSLSTQILNSSSEPMLFILQTCHDLLSTESIIIDEIKHIIKRIFNSDNDNKDIDRKGRDDFLEKAMEILYNLDYDEKTLIAWHSIFKKCLEILPIESPVRINFFNMKSPIKEFFDNLKHHKNVSSRIALIGIIFVHLHSIKAVRERTDSEDQIVEYFLERIGEMSDNNNLNLYKTTVRKLLNDEFSFLRISNQTNNKELLIKSMILHTIAIHSSTSQSFSPLSYYLQRLENCKNDFIMTCPSDIQSVIINAVVNTGQATRAYEESNCPQCNNKIGGLDHVSAPGNIKIDSNPITRSLEINNETGYIMEPPNNDTDHNEFVENWMKLSSLLENKTFSKLLKSELRLRHVIALYELIEEQVSIKMVQYIDNKYKVPIDEETKEIIIKFVKFDQFSIQEKKLPAEDFIIALRRFMYRTLLGELNNENENLVYYFTEISLNLWPNHIKEELISELFPDEFLMCNIYCIYEYIVNEFEMYNKKQQYKVSLSSQNHHSRSNHMSSYKRELVDCEEDKSYGEPGPSSQPTRPYNHNNYNSNNNHNNNPNYDNNINNNNRKNNNNKNRRNRKKNDFDKM
ncbi:5026_t:CDS:2, partial [Entrophospora sp. SA101]